MMLGTGITEFSYSIKYVDYSMLSTQKDIPLLVTLKETFVELVQYITDFSDVSLRK